MKGINQTLLINLQNDFSLITINMMGEKYTENTGL